MRAFADETSERKEVESALKSTVNFNLKYFLN